MSVPGKDQNISTSHSLHSVSVAGVIVDDHERVLLIRRRDNQHWEPPGGVLEIEESVWNGLRRELHEETGLHVRPVALTGVYKNMVRAIVALVFRCQITDGQLHTNAEVTEFRWASRSEVITMATEAFAIRVLDALDFQGAPSIREHDGLRVL